MIACALAAPDPVAIPAFSTAPPGAGLPAGWRPISIPTRRAAEFALVEDSGGTVLREHDEVTVSGRGRPEAADVVTQVFPGFPTDMQAQMMAVASIANGTSVIEDTVYLDRFTHVPELARMGASIELKGNVAVVKGVEGLSGAPVMATDLRASASLVIAGLVAEGETVIDRIYHLDRGYDRMEVKLSAVGADIVRIK